MRLMRETITTQGVAQGNDAVAAGRFIRRQPGATRVDFESIVLRIARTIEPDTEKLMACALINDLKPTPRVTGDLSGKKATMSPVDLGGVSREIERLQSLREQTILEAFCIFEKRYANLAALLLQHFSDRGKAARWMCTYQKAFGGRMGYDVIAEGDDETVWDEIERMG